ncbi:hypothetical protein ACH36K_11235 [Clostridium sp. MB05]|jgi:hypothetical protein
MNKLTKRFQKNSKRRKIKGNLLLEMADDFMDIIHNARLYKRINKNKK